MHSIRFLPQPQELKAKIIAEELPIITERHSGTKISYLNAVKARTNAIKKSCMVDYSPNILSHSSQ